MWDSKETAEETRWIFSGTIPEPTYIMYVHFGSSRIRGVDNFWEWSCKACASMSKSDNPSPLMIRTLRAKQVWDADMITKSKNVNFGGDISRLTKALLKNITVKLLPLLDAMVWNKSKNQRALHCHRTAPCSSQALPVLDEPCSLSCNPPKGK